MSNKSPTDVRKDANPDPRTTRSTSALGHALIALVQEREFGDITVQNILDRAGVGRTTFYAHYRNKEDVLHSSFEHLFSAFEAWLERDKPGARLFPVAEFLNHLRERQQLADSLRRSGHEDEFWGLFTMSAARLIERRLPGGSAKSRQLHARMLAGALVESVCWWQEHPASATPRQLDSAFHALVRRVPF